MNPVKLFLLFLFVISMNGCANLQPAQQSSYVFENAHLFASTAVTFNSDSKLLATGGFKGEIALWSVTDHKLLNILNWHSDTVRALQFIGTNRLISAGDDGYVVLWNTDTKQPVQHIKSTPSTSMAASHQFFITGHRDGSVRLWKLPDISLIKEIKIDGTSIAGLTQHQTTIAAATANGKIALYDTQLNLLRVIQEYGLEPHDLRFNPNGTELAAGSWFTMHIWNVETGQSKTVRTEHNGLLTSLDFSPDGKYLVSLGRHTDSAIRLWNTKNLTVERRYQAHELCGYMIRFSPDGKFMASVSDDESVRLYDLTEPYQPR